MLNLYAAAGMAEFRRVIARRVRAVAVRLTVLTIAFGGVTAGAQAEEISEKDRRRIEKARAAIEAERYSKAIASLRKTSGRDVPCIECLRTLARAYSGFQSFGDAAETIREAIASFPDGEAPFDLYNELGHALYNLAFLPSLEEYEEMAENAGDGFTDWESWDRRRKDSLAESADAFRMAIEGGGAHANVSRVNLAHALYRSGDFEGARQALAEHMEGKPVAAGAEDLQFCVTGRPTMPSLGSLQRTNPPGEGKVVPPKKISTLQPTYNDAARSARVRGAIILEAIIDKEGNVRCPRILKPLPLLDLAAYSAVSEWKFEPATLDGKRVSVIYNLLVNFTLQ